MIQEQEMYLNMATRDKPNNYFAWYNDDDRLAIVVRQQSTDSSKGITSGEYDTYLDSTVTNGIKMTIHSKYEAVTAVTDDLADNAGLDSTMHSSVLDYVKARLSEDQGDLQKSQYFIGKYENKISKASTRRTGVRILLVPEL